jgi:hypothetical protein
MSSDFKLEILNILIKKEIQNLISYLHFKYPKIITKNIKKILIKQYTDKFILLDTLKDKEKLHKKVRKKIVNRKLKIKYNRKIIKNQCEARVWNGGIITKDNYGSRCSRSKKNKSKYCSQHTEHNKHGNYLEETKDEIKEEFEKYNKKD